MKTVKLDVTGCKYGLDMHLRIKEAFHLPNYYGCNWDAFVDMLRFEIDAEFIEIYGENTLSDEWADELRLLHECLDEEKLDRNQNGETFDYVIIS